MTRKIIKQGCDFQDFTDPTECYLGYQDLVIQGLKEFNRTNGALNRVITIE